MPTKIAFSEDIPPGSCGSGISQIREKGADSRELVDYTGFFARNILDRHEKIDFNTVNLEGFIHFFENTDTGICDFFKEHTVNILFPFFDFLKGNYFSRNISIPENIRRILLNHPSLQNGIISYIEQGNSQILSSQHIEQYDTIAFHLFLLGMDQDFDLVKDVQSDYFTKISALFVDSTSRVSHSLGVMKVWMSKNPSETLILELHRCMQLGETINKLALIHSVNFEERQISFDLGVIIRNNIDSLLRQLDPNFIEKHIIGKMLRNLSGKVQGNFAHGIIMKGSVAQINEQASHIKKDQQAGFSLQEAADFGQDDITGELYKKEKKISEIVFLGNNALTELIRIEQIEKLQGSISPELYEEKMKSLKGIIHIYSYAAEKKLETLEEIFMDIDRNGIKNEFQIEALYYLILYGVDIKETSLEKLMIFFLNNKKQVNNFFYEQSDIKIIAQTIKKFRASKERLRFLPLIKKIHASLKEGEISCSVLTYSRIYLSLALYYIECEGKEYMEYAQMCFSRYRDLSAGLVDTDRNPSKTQDEKYFYATLGRTSEIMRYGTSIHHYAGLEKAGKFALEEAVERYQLMAMLSVEAEIGKIIASMNAGDGIFSQDQVNDLFGKKIAETIFYNLCTITVIGDCQNCEKNQDTVECRSYKNSPQTKGEKCSLVPFKRGFQEKYISLAGGISIVFTYPAVSEKIFSKIFSEQHLLIKERFLNLITIHHKNALLQESQTELERLAFYDDETGLPNENKLSRDIFGREKTIVLIDIAGYNNMVATQGGKEDWREIIKKVAEYLKTKTKAAVYSYDKTTFCLVYEPNKFSEMAMLVGEDLQDTVSDFIELLLTNFHIEHGKNVQFHAGIVIGQKTEHIKYAHTALIKARQSREKHLYIFQTGDEQVPEKIRYYTNILVEALDPNNIFTKFVPYYQYIHDPKNPYAKRVEALVRIERQGDDGKTEIIEPGKFVEIAENKRYLSALTMSMLHQIISDMKEDTSLNVSINIHEQDWNDTGIITKLKALSIEPNSIVNRISLEVLETVPFNRPEDREKIRELKSLGYKISIDDYGESEGNIKKIIHVKPDNIKIDQSVILSLYEDEYRAGAIAAIETVIYHAKLIGATVTAERIESKEVFHFLHELGVNFFQGYHFARPVPFTQIQIGDYKGER
ncbi:MAG: GGDEF domain-containing protein [Candidatus Gracilibacteria bacterium]|nr:GGDEF domain-containing protein [Candidatus Gracilibacteria bacterium]